MAAKEIVVEKYVVRLSCGERSLLETLIRKGSSPAHRLLKARILLKADVFEAGEGCSDNRSSRLWQPAHPWFTGCASNWSKKASRPAEPQATRHA